MSLVQAIRVIAAITLMVLASMESEKCVLLAGPRAKGAGPSPQAPGQQVQRETASGAKVVTSGGAAQGQAGSVREEIEFRDGRLSLNVSHRSLLWILKQLSAIQGDVAIRITDERIDRPVTATLEALALDLALRTLLSDEDVLMLYGAVEPEHPSVLQAVIVYPKGQGRERAFSDLSQDAGIELTAAVNSPDETERAQAIEGLIDAFGTRSEELVLGALNDQSDRVREVALRGALEAAFTVPVETLIRLATTDPVPVVRMTATEALASNLEGSDAAQRLSTIAAVAGGDPETNVRESAAKLFAQLTREPARRNR
jgi:HEAT repeats